MPLLDHFHPPVSRQSRWQSFHSGWATYIVDQLNDGLLPDFYRAEEFVKMGAYVEADIATRQQAGADVGTQGNGGVATAIWAPPKPTMTAPVDFIAIDTFEVKIQNEDGVVVAVIELVSAGNKDRPAERLALAGKCASYLQEGVSVIVFDAKTVRTANMHRELMKLLQLSTAEADPGHLFAGAYRVATRRKQVQLEAWLVPLAIGQGLPTLPLWLDDETAIPLDLEKSYSAVCAARHLPV